MTGESHRAGVVGKTVHGITALVGRGVTKGNKINRRYPLSHREGAVVLMRAMTVLCMLRAIRIDRYSNAVLRTCLYRHSALDFSKLANL